MKAIVALTPLLLAGTAGADHDRILTPAAGNAAWKTECSACHLAYPPALLPEDSWRRMMGQLGRHFGQDATLEPAAVKEITAFLVRNSANRTGAKRGAQPAPLRITETGWFLREHDEVTPQTWKRANIGSPSNCGACHAGAAKGDYSERGIRIPR